MSFSAHLDLVFMMHKFSKSLLRSDAKQNAVGATPQKYTVRSLVERVEAMAVIRVKAVEAVVLLSRGSRSTAEDSSNSARSA